MNLQSIKEKIRNNKYFGNTAVQIYHHIWLPLLLQKQKKKKEKQKRIRLLHENGDELLEKFLKICDEAQIDVFLFWGSLLGAVREHDFIPHDDDIDFAVLSQDEFKKIEDAVKGTEFSLCCKFILYGEGTKEIKLRFKDMVFDVFLISCEVKESFSCSYEEIMKLNCNTYCCRTLKIFFPHFHLKEISFRGHMVRIPMEYDAVLRSIYGDDYMIPNSRHRAGSRVKHRESIDFSEYPVFEIKV